MIRIVRKPWLQVIAKNFLGQFYCTERAAFLFAVYPWRLQIWFWRLWFEARFTW